MSNAAMEKYFIQDNKNNCVRYVNDDPKVKLKAYIPMRYKPKNYLIMDEYLSALGIFTVEIGDVKFGLQIPAVITMDPSATYEATIDNTEYLVCEFESGRKIMTNLTVMQDDKVPYFVWLEFMSLGNMPSYITYDNVSKLHDDLSEITGTSLGANHVVLEVVLAHLFRDRNDLNKFYRNTDMREPPATVTLRDVAYGPSATHSRMLGSFANEGRNAALLNQTTTNSELEDIFRE